MLKQLIFYNYSSIVLTPFSSDSWSFVSIRGYIELGCQPYVCMRKDLSHSV